MFWYLLAGLPVERAALYHEWHGYLIMWVMIAIVVCYGFGGLTSRPFDAPFCMCDVNPIAGLVAFVCNVLLTLLSLPAVRRKHWERFLLLGHLQLLFPFFWGLLIYDRVSVFPWTVLSFAQWGFSDMNLRVFMKVLASRP